MTDPEDIVRSIKIKPVPKARPRACRIGRFIRMYTPKATEVFEKAVAAAVGKPPASWIGYDGPVSITVSFRFQAPKSRKLAQGCSWRPHIVRPDLDNLLKSVLDALQRKECGLLTDDSRVCMVQAVKVEATVEPSILLEIKAAKTHD